MIPTPRNKTETKIGKITAASVGFGGYQDCCFGLSLTFESKKEGWGTCTFSGPWSPAKLERSNSAQWSEADRDKQFVELGRLIDRTLHEANVDSVASLVGIPVEVTFEDRILKDWRILTEAI